MDAAPIEREAQCLRGRHARIVRSVARLLAIAGFAFAGWIALATLGGAATADDGTSRSGAPHDLVGTPGPSGPSGPSARNESNLATLRHFKLQRDWSPRETTEVVTGDVREVRERPVGYLRERGRDVARDKDTAVRALRDVATFSDAGVTER